VLWKDVFQVEFFTSAAEFFRLGRKGSGRPDEGRFQDFDQAEVYFVNMKVFPNLK
jgi:hypothetical protein